jgi:uncharacterized protein
MVKVIPRIYEQYLKESLESSFISVLIGPRQAGKTTSVNSFLKTVGKDRQLCLNLDSVFERERIINNENYLRERIEEIIENKLEQLKERFFLFIDEAQKLPAVFEPVKMLYDSFHLLKIVISGSSSLELLDKTAETLAGRVQILRCYPFSISEASFFEGIDDFTCASKIYDRIFSGTLNKKLLSQLIIDHKPRSRKKLQLIDKLGIRSLFPPTFSKIGEDEIPRWLMDYIDTYIERDMRSVKEIGNIEGYRKVISQLAPRAGSLLEYNRLGADAGVNQITTKKYVNIWQESLIGFLLSPFFLNISTRIKKSRKVYFFDNGLIWALSGFREKKFIEASGEIGHYFENLVIADFIKWGINLKTPPTFYFWEKSHVSEIDLVISTRGLTIPIEIKYATSFDKKYLHAIDMFKEKHKEKGLNVPFSLVVYRGDFLTPREDVFCIPVWALC